MASLKKTMPGGDNQATQKLLKEMFERLDAAEREIRLLYDHVASITAAGRHNSASGKLAVIYVLDSEFVCWVPEDWCQGDENRIPWAWREDSW